MKFTQDCKEPQEDPDIMDAWYLYHPMLNLARLARRGDQEAKKLFFDSIDYAIHVAHHFDYHWPVLYNVKTFDVKQNQITGIGETDVACIYALIMVHAYELSNSKRYIKEAEKAAKSIKGLGFNLSYQMNVTSFGISAFWRLYTLTGNAIYKKYAILCIANIFSNSWMWECKYGYAKNYSTFIGIAPLAKMYDNNYLASYEELEVLSAFDDLFDIAEASEVSSSVQLLLSEYTRYVLDRCWSYFPSELPKDILAEKPKTGKINPKLAFPLEDLREGWQKSGQIGQEVYGAGAIFITVTRHFNHKQGWPFRIFCEYPTAKYTLNQENSENSVKFHIFGDSRLKCQLRLIPLRRKKLPVAEVFSYNTDGYKAITSYLDKNGDPYFVVSGDTDILITWKK
jgi:hypothetical protein